MYDITRTLYDTELKGSNSADNEDVKVYNHIPDTGSVI